MVCLMRKSSRATTNAVLGFGVLFVAGWRKSEAPLPPPLPAQAASVDDTAFFRAQAVGAAIEGNPWIAHVKTVDLDRDGLLDTLVCDARANQVTWIRQTSPGRFEETVLAADLPAPVHVEAVDIDVDGNLDLLIASMGQVFPNNDQIGSVIILENDGHSGSPRM